MLLSYPLCIKPGTICTHSFTHPHTNTRCRLSRCVGQPTILVKHTTHTIAHMHSHPRSTEKPISLYKWVVLVILRVCKCVCLCAFANGNCMCFQNVHQLPLFTICRISVSSSRNRRVLISFARFGTTCKSKPTSLVQLCCYLDIILLHANAWPSKKQATQTLKGAKRSTITCSCSSRRHAVGAVAVAVVVILLVIVLTQ